MRPNSKLKSKAVMESLTIDNDDRRPSDGLRQETAARFSQLDFSSDEFNAIDELDDMYMGSLGSEGDFDGFVERRS